MIQIDIKCVVKWVKENGLTLNSNKTHAMIISAPNNPSFDLEMNLPPHLVEGTPITYKDIVKDLGLNLDQT